MWLRISKKYNFILQDYFSIYSRQHDAQGSKTMKSHAREDFFFYRNNLKEMLEYYKYDKKIMLQILQCRYKYGPRKALTYSMSFFVRNTPSKAFLLWVFYLFFTNFFSMIKKRIKKFIGQI
jgi:hypothetical protein